jgi:hypothetical protein
MEFDREITRPALDPHLRRRLRANLDEMAICRPHVAQELTNALPQASATLVRGRWGMRTLAFAADRAFRIPDPMTETLDVLREINPALQRAEPVALCGIGAGYVLDALTAWQSPVLVIEPDPRAVLASLLLHDFSGPRGPIRAQRFHWAVGENWLEQLRQYIAKHSAWQIPKIFIRQNPQSAGIELALLNLAQENLACV